MQMLIGLFDGCKYSILLILLVLGVFASCGGGGGSSNSGSTTPNQITYTQVDFGTGAGGWQGIEPMITDTIGDNSDAGVDISKAFLAYDENYLYMRVEIIGEVDAAAEGQLTVDFVFADAQNPRTLSISALVFLGEVQMSQFDNGNSDACNGVNILMSYPAQNYLTLENHAIEFRILLTHLDWNLDGAALSVDVRKKNNTDNTAAVTIDMDTSYLANVVAVWPDSHVVTNYIIPTASISVDGNLSDWAAVTPVFVDALDDVHGVPTANIDQVFIAQDSDSFYIRFDLAAAPMLMPGTVGQCRLELGDPLNVDEVYFITAWLNSSQSQIQDTKAIDVGTGADGNIHTYSGAGYYFQNGRFLEYRILKSDFPRALGNLCLSATSIIDGASDYVFPVYLP